MLYFGFLLIALAGGLFVFEKCEKIKRTAAEYKATLSLLVYLKGAIAAERKTPSEAILSFREREEGSAVPWLAGLDTGERVNSFLREKRLLSSECGLSGADKRDIAAFFADVGRHSAQEECRLLSGVIGAIEKASAKISEESEKNVKTLWLLFITVALGALIIIL